MCVCVCNGFVEVRGGSWRFVEDHLARASRARYHIFKKKMFEEQRNVYTTCKLPLFSLYILLSQRFNTKSVSTASNPYRSRIALISLVIQVCILVDTWLPLNNARYKYLNQSNNQGTSYNIAVWVGAYDATSELSTDNIGAIRVSGELFFKDA